VGMDAEQKQVEVKWDQLLPMLKHGH
jgi:hypothetical protein